MPGSDPTVGAILLAAGRSERFGAQNKLLATIDGRPIVKLAARPLLEAPLDEHVAIVGDEGTAVGDALSVGFDVRCNDRTEEGQHTSVHEGVAVARERDWDGAVFALGDMPFVAAETLERLVEAYRGGRGSVVVPVYDGTRGNPVLFDAAHFDALGGVSGDEGGREIVANYAGTVRVAVDDPGIRRDIDRPGDLPSA